MKVVHVYIVPLAILASLYYVFEWVPVQLALEWMVPLAAAHVPAWIPAFQIIVVIALIVGGAFALIILWMTRHLQTQVIYKERDELFESKRNQGHESIAASVFDPRSIELETRARKPDEQACALERDPRLAMLVSSLWAKPEFHNFVNRLIGDPPRHSSISLAMREELGFLRKLYTRNARLLNRHTLPPARRRVGKVISYNHRFVSLLLLMVLLLLPVA